MEIVDAGQSREAESVDGDRPVGWSSDNVEITSLLIFWGLEI